MTIANGKKMHYAQGEPEDQSLGRDFRWVIKALNAAFDAGRENA